MWEQAFNFVPAKDRETEQIGLRLRMGLQVWRSQLVGELTCMCGRGKLESIVRIQLKCTPSSTPDTNTTVVYTLKMLQRAQIKVISGH